jgi:spermidine/putrescine transport system permease protein
MGSARRMLRADMMLVAGRDRETQMAEVMANPSRSELKQAVPLLLPAYVWLLVAIFLPLSAMVFFSFMSDMPMAGREWSFTLANYEAFLNNGVYLTLMGASLRLGLEVTFWCLMIGFPAAYVLAKVLKGRSREAVFLLVILPFWSNGLVRIFSWAMVLREGGILDTWLNAILPFRISIDLMYSYPAIIIGLVHSYVPYVVLTCYLSLQAIDDSLIEAARSLGASRLRVLRRIILPLALPGILAGAVLIFVPVVGSFMEPRILGGRTGTFYGTVIEDQFVAVFNWPLGAALSFILLGVVLVILAAASPIMRRAQ